MNKNADFPRIAGRRHDVADSHQLCVQSLSFTMRMHFLEIKLIRSTKLIV